MKDLILKIALILFILFILFYLNIKINEIKIKVNMILHNQKDPNFKYTWNKKDE